MGAFAITFRAATDRDLAEIDTVLSQSYPRLLKNDYPPSVMVTAVPLISRANPALVHSGSYYVAEGPDGEILGAGGWSYPSERTDVAEVRHVVTHWKHLRRGIGRRLIEGLMREARLHGVCRFECQATRTAVPFYKALGFEVRGAVNVPLRPGIEFPAVVMRRVV